MEIIVTKNFAEMSRVTANLAIAQLHKKKSSVFGLATGNTPIGFYRNLVQAVKRKEISLARATTISLDEFARLDPAHRGSLFYYMRTHFFDKVDLLPKNIHMLDGCAVDLKKECKRYERLIKEKRGIDWQLLGIGANGHIAWAEPGTSFTSRTQVLDLTKSSRQAQLKNFKNLKEMPTQGMTMGIGTIMEAKQIVLLASGEGKAEIIARALRGKVTKEVPASVLQRHPRLIVVLDQPAASKL
ncbi:MAG: glucosamine-6-phosphate deaminase [Candidatus Falkowbacteria bacterium]